jgi:hypothetical protein
MDSDHMDRRTECNSVQAATCGTLHVVVFQDVPGQWIGRVLEHDMLTEARTTAAPPGEGRAGEAGLAGQA